ncbi:MAG TPA: hypothetical protein VGE20_06005, partial [Ramlibacter sp.]
MSFLLISLVVLAVVAAAGVLAYAQMQQWSEEDEAIAPAPGVDYGALQAQWRGLAPARDWESLRTQVRGWHQAAACGAASAHFEEVARNLNQAVFRFAVPGEPLALGRAAIDGAADRQAAAH